MRAALTWILTTALLPAQTSIRGFREDHAASQRQLEARARPVPETVRIQEYIRFMSRCASLRAA